MSIELHRLRAVLMSQFHNPARTVLADAPVDPLYERACGEPALAWTCPGCSKRVRHVLKARADREKRRGQDA